MSLPSSTDAFQDFAIRVSGNYLLGLRRQSSFFDGPGIQIEEDIAPSNSCGRFVVLHALGIGRVGRVKEGPHTAWKQGFPWIILNWDSGTLGTGRGWWWWCCCCRVGLKMR